MHVIFDDELQSVKLLCIQTCDVTTQSFQVGHKLGDQFTFNWWDHVFNKASSNLSVEAGQVVLLSTQCLPLHLHSCQNY